MSRFYGSLCTVIVQHPAGELATKRTLQLTITIQADIWIYRITELSQAAQARA